MLLKKVWFVQALFVWLAFSSLIIAISYNIVGHGINLIFFKDLAIIAVFGIGVLFSTSRDINPFLALIPLVFWITISLILSPASLFAKAASLRQMMMPFLLILLGYLFTHNQSDVDRLLNTVRIVLYIVLAFGFLEMAISIWKFVDIRTYYEMKGIFVNKNGYPFIFIEPIQGGIRRMASTFLDPINLGHALVFLLAIRYYQRARWAEIIVIFIGIALTISKGALLQLVLVFWVINKRKPMFDKLFVAATIVVLSVYLSFNHAGLSKHVAGFSNALSTFSLTGMGMAMAGNQAHMYSATYTDSIGDTFIGAIIGQVGIIGLLLWLLPFIHFMRFFKKYDILKRLLIAQVIVSILSENAFNLLSIVALCLVIGSQLAVNYQHVRSLR